MELNINSGKKIIIGVSILFCAVILIIGATIAFFTQGDSKDIDDIVSVYDVLLDYNDDLNNYMRGV